MIPKFRAFYKANQKMYEVLTLDIIDKKAFVENNDDPGKPLRGYANISEIELMQSTGLKDKNGVEIFEGDIVINRYGNYYKPIYQNGIYMAYKPDKIHKDLVVTQFNIIVREGCEVVGNIYENKELLND